MIWVLRKPLLRRDWFLLVEPERVRPAPAPKGAWPVFLSASRHSEGGVASQSVIVRYRKRGLALVLSELYVGATKGGVAYLSDSVTSS